MKLREKHIERLTRGQKSGAKIGSRAVGHRLRPHERTAYRLAVRHGYMTQKPNQRGNLVNVWHQHCTIKQHLAWVLRQHDDGTATVLRDEAVRHTGSWHTAKAYVQDARTPKP